MSIAGFVIIFALVALFEILHQNYKRKEQPFADTEKLISRNEFDERIKRGEQLVLLDDLVLDVSRFKYEHPGGAFLLDIHIGRDISKYFYGGYVLENESKMKPHTHSNVGRAIVNSLIVAKIHASAKTFKANITVSEELNKTTKVFTLKLHGADSTF